ncbi:MAG: PQQ-binding-like beta-propeller repeat protein [Kiritimatiellae bacterium]|nr:PQQ-binding-like beta-propeller repeat protein [Kiritimatiellia bacterium]MDD5521772.1 PQQ-binding-like beta-propeller repeat protein [Kiritimatiellia bacterium]
MKFWKFSNVLFMLIFLSPCLAADWPMWRCDANRSAASPAGLPDKLSLHWTRKLPPPRPAWQIEPRLQFDTSYEPVVAGKTFFLASQMQDTLTAYDTETGEERWVFLAGGPIRFAPVIWNGKVLFVSDDGYLYCLDAASGKQVWSFRGSQQHERKHLGNGRLVSFWAARGGPVVADGTVYFTAGIWPSMGIYIHAVDVETGRAVWTNSDMDFLENVRIDHNNVKDAGLSPQGYLVISGDSLIMPNGRSQPAILDRKTGKLLHYIQGYRNGHCRVTAMGNYAFVGTGGIVDITTGREVGSRFADAGTNAPPAFDINRFEFFEGPISPYNFMPGCSSWSVLTPNIIYGFQQGTCYAYDLKQPPSVKEYESKVPSGRMSKPWRWDLVNLWKEKIAGNAQCRTLIKADNRLYGHFGNELVAVELSSSSEKKPKVTWKQKVSDMPASMVAADDKLFVVTTNGTIHCFAAGTAKPSTFDIVNTPLPQTTDKWNDKAAQILKTTGVSDGYCLVLGLDAGRLVEELLNQSKFQVIAVDSDAKKVDALRRRFIAAGLYGNRVEVHCGNPDTFPFPQYLANLIVSESAVPSELATAQTMPGLYSTLRPYGGVACLSLSDAEHANLQKVLTENAQESSKLTRADGLSLLQRVGPLPGSAFWTHETSTAARTYYSADDRVKAPLGVLWYGHGSGPHFSQVNDYDSGVKPQVVGGRMFALRQNPPLLHAMDVYTGRVIWTQPTDRYARFASMEDGIYVVSKGECKVYDPACGKERAAYPLKVKEAGRKTPVTRCIRVGNDTIVIGVGFDAKGGITEEPWDSKALIALDRSTGKHLWTYMARNRVGFHALALGDGLVFCADSISPTIAGKDMKPGQTITNAETMVLALDIRTGAEKWAVPDKRPSSVFMAAHWPSQRGNDDWVAYAEELKIVLAGKRSGTSAYEAKTGKQIWSKSIGGQPMIIHGKTFMNQGGGNYDVLTGESLGGNSQIVKRLGCNYMVGSKHLLLMRDASASYADIESQTRYWLRNLRSGCSSSLIAADGVLVLPCFSSGCVCNYPVQTSLAMVYMPEMANWAHGIQVKPK